MNIERLNHLVTILKSIPEEYFDMDTWVRHCACGTIACAGGWAAKDPWFNELGLFHDLIPQFNGYSDYRALAHFFDLDMETTRQLFCPMTYPTTFMVAASTTPKEVIERIHQTISEGSL